MLLRSSEGSIEIVRGSFDDPWDIDATVSSRGFSGRVWNIFPGNVGAFFSAIRAIERDGTGRAVLVGTEDFEFAVELISPNGAFAATVQMKLFAGYGRGEATHLLRCCLPIAGEYWQTMVDGLRAELVGYPPAAS